MTEPLTQTADVQFTALARVLQDEVQQFEKVPRRVILQSGRFLHRIASSSLYRFEVPEHIKLRGLDRVVMTFGRVEPVEIPCRVASIENQFITLALPIDIGPVIPEVECTWNYAERMRLLIDQLNVLREGEGIARHLFQPRGAANQTSPLFETSVPADAPLEYSDVLKKIAQNRVSFLWGPILSGKTDILALVAVNVVRAGKKVLVVAPTSECVDGILARAVDVGEKLGVDMVALTSRVGLSSSLDSEVMAQISFEVQLDATKREQSKQDIELVERYWDVRIKKILHEDYYTALEDLRKRTAEAKERFDRVTAELNAARTALTKLEQASMLEKMKKSYKDELAQTQKLVAEKQSFQKRYQAQVAALSAELPKMELQAPIKADELKAFEQTLARIKEQGGLEAVVEKVEQAGLAKEAEALRNKKLIGTTLMTALAPPLAGRLNDRRFDLVIVDDAEVVNLPTMAVVASHAVEQMVVSGDPFQVDPESLTNTELAQEWLQRDIFMYAAGTENLHELFAWSRHNSRWSIFLSSQFATTPKLSRFVNSVLFDGELKVQAPADVKGKIFFCDTSSLRASCKQYAGKKKVLPFNSEQAARTVECVKHAMLEGGRVAGEIGVITPMPGQTLYVKQLLRLDGIQNVEVGTPQTFRGRRKKAIIFDTTMAGVDYTVRPLDDKKVGEQRIASLLNTVFSCATDDLYVLADMSHFGGLYKDRLFTKLLTLLQAESDGQPSTGRASKRFEELEWDEREPLYALRAGDVDLPRVKRANAPPTMDAELELQMKMMAKQQKPMAAGTARNLERETYHTVLRVVGRRADLNMLSQFLGGDALFHNSLAAEHAAQRLPIDFCQNEKDFREIVERWNLLIYEMSGGKKSDATFFKQAPETRVRWDLNTMKAFYTFDADAVVEEGKQKLAMAVSKIFQETIGKPQPSSPSEWAQGYLGFLAKLESYLRWIDAQIKK